MAKSQRFNIAIGQRFRKLTVVRELPPKNKRYRMFLLLCDCGNEVSTRLDKLLAGRTGSCGCYQATKNIVHGFRYHPLYGVWESMVRRCANLDNPNYGGRGISVCLEWQNDVGEFVRWGISHGWKRGLQCDRIDNDGNYEPSNCRFVNSQVNRDNRTRREKATTRICAALSLPV